MIGTYKNIFGGAWYMSQDAVLAHIPYIYSLVSGSPMNIQLETIPKEIIHLSTVGDYNPQSTGSISRIYINKHDYVGVLKFHSAITKNDVSCGPRGTQTMASVVQRWQNDGNCIGLLQDHDSGGGEASGTRHLARTIKEDFTKPSVTFWRGTMASASAYIGCSADRVYVDQDAELGGSIGALGTYMDIMPALEKLGVVNHLILADGSEDKIKSHRDMLKGDYALIKKEGLNVLREEFKTWMQDVRPKLSEKALTGKVYRPKKAISIGLADEIGTFQTAFDYIVEQHDLQDNSKSNTHMAKEDKVYPNLQKALGLEKSLTLKKGFFASESTVAFSVSQIDAIETALGNTGSATTAKELTDVQAELATEKAKNEEITTLVDESMTTLGLEKQADVQANITSIVETTQEYGKQPGETNTKPDLSQDGNKGVDPEFAEIDFDAEMYDPLKNL